MVMVIAFRRAPQRGPSRPAVCPGLRWPPDLFRYPPTLQPDPPHHPARPQTKDASQVVKNSCAHMRRARRHAPTCRRSCAGGAAHSLAEALWASTTVPERPAHSEATSGHAPGSRSPRPAAWCGPRLWPTPRGTTGWRTGNAEMLAASNLSAKRWGPGQTDPLRLPWTDSEHHPARDDRMRRAVGRHRHALGRRRLRGGRVLRVRAVCELCSPPSRVFGKNGGLLTVARPDAVFTGMTWPILYKHDTCHA